MWKTVFTCVLACTIWVVIFALASLELIVDFSLSDPYLSRGPPPIQFILIEWDNWLAYVTVSASVKNETKRFSSFCHLLWWLPVLPFDFGGWYCQSNKSFYHLYIVGNLVMFLCYPHSPQSVNPFRLVSAGLETFVSTTWLPCLPAFAQVCSLTGKPLHMCSTNPLTHIPSVAYIVK